MISRCVVIVLDGLGDRSYLELDNMTPLQAAATPHMDALAARGINGMFHAASVGMAFSSQDAHYSLFGYEWSEAPRRSVLEAVAAGIKLAPEDVVALARLAAAGEENGTLMIKNRLPRASPEEIAAVMAEVDTFESAGISFRFTQVDKLEGILVIKGNVSPLITDADPIGDGLVAAAVRPLQPAADDPAAKATAVALERYLTWVYNRLEGHPLNKARIDRGEEPLNAFVTHLADQLRPVMPFKQRWGLKGLSISSKLVQEGLSAVLGMDRIRVQRNSDPARDLSERISIAVENLAAYDFVHVHSMAPDEAAHTKDPLAKKKVIEALDHAIGESLPKLLSRPDLLLVITSDHSTPSSGLLIHSGETVPMTISGPGVRVDKVTRFNEIDCAGGALGLVRGKEFMYLVVNHLDRCKLPRIMNAPYEQEFWPGEYEPFRLH
jgi:2,3-bisphosphoglycerate-independent phosphoglycerate mutase